MDDRSERLAHLVTLGILAWLVPFVVSIPIESAVGEPAIDPVAHQTISFLVVTVVGALLFAYAVPRLPANYVAGAITAGIVWFAVAVVLDLAVLVGVFGMPVEEWAVSHGARFLVFPILGVVVGYVASRV